MVSSQGGHHAQAEDGGLPRRQAAAAGHGSRRAADKPIAYAMEAPEPTRWPSRVALKLSVMDPALPTRFASGLLVLLACAVALHRHSDRTPTRMVTEIVSVVHVPARAPEGGQLAAPALLAMAEDPPAAATGAPQPAPAPAATAAIPATLASAAAPASGAAPDAPGVQRAELVADTAALKAALPEPPVRVVARAAARRSAQEPSPGVRSQPTQRPPVRVLASACRTAACHAGAGARSAGRRHPPGAETTAHARLPRILLPVRHFGLFLQAKLLTPEERRTASADAGG